MPLVAILGAAELDAHGPFINALLSSGALALMWVLLGRIGVRRLDERSWLLVLFGFSTVLWWVTTRGGVWHTGQIIATILTVACLVELWGRQRPLVVGLLAGAAFLTRAPLALAIPFYLLMLRPDRSPEAPETVGGYVRSVLDRRPIGAWALLVAGVLPSLLFFFWYNAVRFGSPLESGYAMAALPAWLEARRQMGLFSLDHLGWNLELLLLHLPQRIDQFPYFRPDGLGMSVLLTSPALLLAAWAPWRVARAWWLLGAAVAVLIPTLLYYGGGWLQYGYRYFLDSIPFVVALAAMAVARRGLAWPWILLILFGVFVNLGGVYWVDKF